MPSRSRINFPLGKKLKKLRQGFVLPPSNHFTPNGWQNTTTKLRQKFGSTTVIINGWKAAGIYDAIKAESSGLQSIDPLEDISPLVIEHDESESFLPATIDQLTDELRENFVNVPFDEENSEWEQSDNEDDVDSERNIFDDIIIDDE